MRDAAAGISVKYLENWFSHDSSAPELTKDKKQPTYKEGMSISAAEASILKFLIQSHSYKKAVEIGCFAAYSSLWIAEAIDGGELHTFEYNKEHAEIAKEVIAAYEGPSKITLHQGDARQALASIESEAPFDFVFIDANKAGYYEYFLWAEKNLRSGGMIVGDNTLLFGEVGLDQPERVSNSQWREMRKFNEAMADSEKFISCFVPTTEGLTIALKR
ncbi:MAG: class I SAM-dependent methyltransferase [Bdellovibrionota bacterium]